MAKITWDAVGERFYETGVDHAVLYVRDTAGLYPAGVPWNGLTAVTETPSGAEANPQYADNIKYLNLVGAEEFGATIEAFFYPDEFMECDGSVEVAPGVIAGQQTRKVFGMSYRTLIGNDVEGNDYGYKLHLLYGALASPSERNYTTVSDSPEANPFSWEVTTTPVSAGDGLKPVSILTIESKKSTPEKMAALEAILYGSTTDEARLPLPEEVFTLMAAA